MSDERYSHGHHESVLRSHRWRTAENSAGYLLSHLEPGFQLLDVGCGPGNITADLARFVPGGSVIGLDRSEEVIAQARADYANPDAGLRFETGDVYHLDFPDGTFDVVHAHQVLQHLARPLDALREMRRVAKPGGIVAVRDADYGAFVWWPRDPVLDTWMDVYHQITARNGANADGGRELKAWAHAAGFTEVTVSTSNWTYTTPQERDWWGGLWADRVVESEFAKQGIEYGVVTMRDLEEIARAFRRWSEEPDGIFVVVNFEILARA